jgi:hypothetical protein
MIMKSMSVLACSIVVMAGFAGMARADDPITDPAVYKQKMHDCVTQMKTDKPDMNYKARRKACHQQLGPAPKAAPSATPSATPPATTTPPSKP